ncbi:MAG TPA: hypothetical protein VK614_11145 [Allosphingosinicella sp.]|nr:hypothetical protein [Allosphingosinicella sp.]
MTTFRSDSAALRALAGIAACTFPFLTACSNHQERTADDEAGLTGPSLPPTNEGIAFTVASDPNATYRLLRWSRMPNGHIEATTRQDSRYGTILSRQEISCADRTYRVLGEGETEEAARRNQANVGPMSDLVEGSIRDVTVAVVCREAHQ